MRSIQFIENMNKKNNKKPGKPMKKQIEIIVQKKKPAVSILNLSLLVLAQTYMNLSITRTLVSGQKRKAFKGSLIISGESTLYQ